MTPKNSCSSWTWPRFAGPRQSNLGAKETICTAPIHFVAAHLNMWRQRASILSEELNKAVAVSGEKIHGHVRIQGQFAEDHVPFSFPESSQILAGITLYDPGKSGMKFPDRRSFSENSSWKEFEFSNAWLEIHCKICVALQRAPGWTTRRGRRLRLNSPAFVKTWCSPCLSPLSEVKITPSHCIAANFQTTPSKKYY